MIICTNCGFENDDDSRFCGGCQEFLDWTGEAIETDDEVETEPVVEDEAHRGIVDRVVDRIRGPEEEPEGTLPDSTAHTATTGREPAIGDPAAAIASETAERAERDAEAAEQQRQEAEQRAREQTEATERARAHAEQAERARREAEDLARQEAEAAERIRAELEAARTAREEAESQLQQEAQAAEQAREAAERQREDTAMVADEERQQTAEAERARADAAARLQAEREAMERAEADLEQAEAGRRAAEARARAESDAAEAARQASAAAEAARLAAEEKAREEARVAEQARRAAALVARPRPAPPTTEAEGSERSPAPERTRARQPARRSRRRRGADAVAPTTPSEAADETPPPTTGPAPVKPDRTRVRPVAKAGRTAPERRLRPGDLVCGQCGEGNTPTRNFCRRCGNTLAEAEVVRAPWWKRLVPRRRPKVYAAGARPSRGQPGDGGPEAAGTAGGKGGGTKGVKGAVRGAQGLKRKILGPIGKIGRPLMFVGIALAAVGITFNPGIRGSLTGGAGDLFDRVRGFIAPQFEPVIPVDVTASSSLPDHPPERAIDNTSDRWWAEGAEGNGEGESLVVTFAEPVDIAAVGVTPGAAETEEFVAQPRPRQLHLVFDTGVTADLNLSDEHEFQSFEVDAPGVTSVEVQVIEVWQGQSGSDMALTTLEFRTAS